MDFRQRTATGFDDSGGPRDLDVLFVAHETAGVASAVEGLVRGGFVLTTRRVETEASLAEALKSRRPDVVVCRSDLRSVSALRCLDLTQHRLPNVPFVLFGDLADDAIGRAMQQGASGHVPDAYLSELGAVVERALVDAAMRARGRDAETARRVHESHVERTQRLDAVARLAGALSREFNDLLAAILTSSGSLMKSIERSDPRRADVASITAAGERGDWLIRQLLIFSRQHVMPRTRIALNRVLQNMSSMLRRLLRDDIELVWRLAPDLGWVDADVGQFEHAVLNLVVNAQDAMLSGGTITIETANVQRQSNPHEAPTAWVRVTVRDTGYGMDPQTLERIFEPFFTTKDTYAGTGFGLSTVYGIVRQIDGTIEAESEVGVGSRFRMDLPCCREHAAPGSVDGDASGGSGGYERGAPPYSAAIDA